MTTIREDALKRHGCVNFNRCPHYYGYPNSEVCKNSGEISCNDCWDRELVITCLSEVKDAFPEIEEHEIIMDHCPTDFGYLKTITEYCLFSNCRKCWEGQAVDNQKIKDAKEKSEKIKKLNPDELTCIRWVFENDPKKKGVKFRNVKEKIEHVVLSDCPSDYGLKCDCIFRKSLNERVLSDCRRCWCHIAEPMEW